MSDPAQFIDIVTSTIGAPTFSPMVFKTSHRVSDTSQKVLEASQSLNGQLDGHTRRRNHSRNCSFVGFRVRVRFSVIGPVSFR